MPSPCILGVDLAGPAGAANTAVALFLEDGDRLEFQPRACDGSDAHIFELVSELSKGHPVVIGLDAPLSYGPGGGQRPADAALRRRLTDLGMPPGSVMAPTAPRMAYLTLRGVVLARAISSLETDFSVDVAEVHPSACMALRGAPVAPIRGFAASVRARVELLEWLSTQGLRGVPTQAVTGHFVAACAATLAAWHWFRGRPAWLAAAEPPWHPYDFAC